MSDDDGIPHAPSTAAPRRGNRWSEEDSRTLVIGIAGGLAANVGVVILTGLAVAFLRWYAPKGSDTSAVVLPFGIVALFGAFAIGLGIRVDGTVHDHLRCASPRGCRRRELDDLPFHRRCCAVFPSDNVAPGLWVHQADRLCRELAQAGCLCPDRAWIASVTSFVDPSSAVNDLLPKVAQAFLM